MRLSIPRTRQFWSVGLAHMTNDIFMSGGIVLLTFLSGGLVPMSNTEIGFAVSAKQLAGALSQPVFGLMADRRGGRWLGVAGLTFTVSMFILSIVMAVTTRDYWLMLIPFILQGIGSGAVHPVGMLNTAESDKSRVASNMSYFFLMGQMGLALGPALIGLLLDAANATPLTVVTGAVAMPGVFTLQSNVMPLYALLLIALPPLAMMARSIPIRAAEKRERKVVDPDAPRIPWWRVAAPFAVIGFLVLLRALANPGSVNFIPVLFQQKGWTPAEYGLITSLFWVASGISGVVFGNLADRYDRRWVMMASMSLAAPTFFLLPLSDGLIALVLAVAAGGLSGGAHSIIVVLTQDLIPASKGFAGGAILGFIFGTGALGSLLIGSLSDSIGLGTTFQMVAFASLGSGLIALLLPRRS